MKNFAITGVAGFVAPRHLKAIATPAIGSSPPSIRTTRSACSIATRSTSGSSPRSSGSTGTSRSCGAGPTTERVHYVSICSPNYLHDAHMRLALRVGADAICEKPLVINPWNLDALQELERETGRRVYTVLQLRLHPAADRAARARSRRRGDAAHDVSLTYVTSRGRWYDVSWKGSEERSGGIVTNIGIHFFDLLLWLFGRRARLRGAPARADADGRASRARARRVRWFLSTDPPTCRSRRSRARRRRSDRSRSTAKRSSSATASPISTRASTKKCWPAAASASTTRGRRSSWRTASGRRRVDRAARRAASEAGAAMSVRLAYFAHESGYVDEAARSATARRSGTSPTS